MKYDIKELRRREDDLALFVRQHFSDFFKKHDYIADSQDVVSYSIKTLADIERTYYGTGFYLILTDYMDSENCCSFVVGGLKAIYRGHCYTVKSRLKSHLFNAHYRSKLPERGVRYDVCMKLDDNNGINISEPPYNQYKWRVIVHKMKCSSKMIREQAEHAFDEVFSRPIGSKEGKVEEG